MRALRAGRKQDPAEGCAFNADFAGQGLVGQGVVDALSLRIVLRGFEGLLDGIGDLAGALFFNLEPRLLVDFGGELVAILLDEQRIHAQTIEGALLADGAEIAEVIAIFGIGGFPLAHTQQRRGGEHGGEIGFRIDRAGQQEIGGLGWLEAGFDAVVDGIAGGGGG